MPDFTPSQPGALAQRPVTAPTLVGPNVQQVDFNDPTVKQWDFELYSGRTAHTDVLQILTMPVKARIHYHDNLTGGVLCTSRYERSPDGNSEDLVEQKLCCKMLGDPQQRFAVLVLQHGTDQNGIINFSPYRYSMKLWRFGKDKFTAIRTVNKDWPFEKHDYSIVCSDQKMQKLQIGAKPNALLQDPNFPPDVRAIIEGWVKANAPKLPNQLGAREYNDGDLMKLLREKGVLTAAPGAPAPTFQTTDAPIAGFGDVINQAAPQPQPQLSAPAVPSTTGQ